MSEFPPSRPFSESAGEGGDDELAVKPLSDDGDDAVGEPLMDPELGGAVQALRRPGPAPA